MRIALFVSIVVAHIVAMAHPGHAYNDEAHRQINEKAATASTLDAFLRQRLGFREGIREQLRRGPLLQGTVTQWLVVGAEQEDNPACRRARHFHDPLRPWDSAGLFTENLIVRGRCLSLSYASSVHWSQDPSQTPGGQWAWPDARRLFFSALTSPTRTAREQSFADTFRALGQLMHLVADASVPEHVRNDPHVLEGACRMVGASCLGSYEYWVTDRIQAADPAILGLFESPFLFAPGLLQQPTGDARAPVPVARLIDSDAYLGLATGPNVTRGPEIGLAEFANANFFSEDTVSDPRYPFPDVTRLRREALPDTSGGVRAYFFKDPEDGFDVAGPVLAECALFRLDLLLGGLAPSRSCPDKRVWETTARAMLPRATGYAAGVLDYFFRGRLGGVLQRAEGTVASFAAPPYTVRLDLTNQGAEDMQGDFRLYADAPNGTRTQLAGPELDASGGWTQQSLARGAMRTFTFTVPNGFGVVDRFLVVFRGQLGLESGAVAVGIVDPAQVLEPWNRDLTGNHPWAHSKLTTILGTNPDNGTLDDRVAAGRLVKENTRFAGEEDARFNQSFLGPIIREGALVRTHQDVLPVPITSRTVIRVKIDESSINAQPPCQPDRTCAWQILQFEFNGGRTIQVSVPGQGVNLGGRLAFVSATPGVPVTFNVHEELTRAGIPLDNLLLGGISINQQIFPYVDPVTGRAFEPDPLPRQQRMRIDYIWVGDADATRDTDGDGLPDVYEVQNGLDPSDAADATADADGDGLSNRDEQAAGGDPNNPDTDGDGLPDGLEVAIAGSAIAADPHADFDRDGVSNLNEVLLACNPLLVDVTTVTGRAVDQRGNPVADATVQVLTQVGSTGRTSVQGTFSLSGVGACPPSIQVVASARVGATPVEGTSAVVPAVTGGNTSVGDVVLTVLEGTLFPGSRLGTGLLPRSAAVADLDGDGNPDIVTANGSSNDVSVFLGRGNGTFQLQQSFATGFFPLAVVVADLNRDGRLDVVTPNGGGNLSVLLGRGDGSLEAPRTIIVVPGGSPSAVAVADLDRDGILDLVTANGISRSYSVLLGNGDGTFQPERRVALANAPQKVVVADFDLDGVPDLVLADSDLAIHLGNGDGTFQPERRLAAGFSTAALSAVDLNRDGIPDLVGGVSLDVAVALGRGDGGFQATRFFRLADPAIGVAVADFNGDGVPDVATASMFGDIVSVLLGNGDGTLQAERQVAAGPFPFALAVGDLNRDGAADLVAVNAFTQSFPRSEGISLLLGNGDGTFQVADPVVSADVSTVADLDRDGIPDVVAISNWLTNQIVVRLGNGDGTFQPERPFGVGVQPVSVAVADLNGDGIPDVVTTNFGPPGSVSVLLGNGDGTFQPERRSTAGAGFWGAVGDFDRDGRADVVLANATSNDVSVLLGNGNGTFQVERRLGVGGFPRFVLAADVNGDGITDLVTVNASSRDVSVLLGNGDGSFQAQRRFAVGNFPAAAFAADVDADGVVDLVVANEMSDDLSVLRGNGDGTFQAERRLIVGDGPTAVAAADLDGDGVMDVVAVNSGSKDFSVLLGTGAGAFDSEQRFVGHRRGAVTSITVADLDLDGLPDLVIAGSVLLKPRP